MFFFYYIYIFLFISIDMNFFINICQTLNIPFFTENSELNTKKCGLRNPEYIMKLSTLRSVFENHYVNIIYIYIYYFISIVTITILKYD